MTDFENAAFVVFTVLAASSWRCPIGIFPPQMTDFENAAFVVFTVLISRVLLALELNLYIPISKLEENMRTAHKMDAVTKGRFWFRKDLLPRGVRRRMQRKCHDKVGLPHVGFVGGRCRGSFTKKVAFVCGLLRRQSVVLDSSA